MRWFTMVPLCLTACGPESRPNLSDLNAERACADSAILALLNADDTTSDTLQDIGLRSPAAYHLMHTRSGVDGLLGTDDDVQFEDLDEVDAVSYVGPVSMETLQTWGESQCSTTDTCTEPAIVGLVNDPVTTAQTLKDIGVYSTGAHNLITARDASTLTSLDEIDAVAYVGEGSIAALTTWGEARCMGTVAFSPASYYDSHIAQTADEIGLAADTIDVAMYSFSDTTMVDALESAVERGVSVRVLFHGAQDDRNDLEGSRSAQLEDLGIEVRWVNKIMHHKLAIIDGPRTDTDAAHSGVLITGSANWSYSAATKYDENTLFLRGDARLLLSYQREFNLLWDHSRPIEWNEDIAEISHTDISDDDIDRASGSEAVFTSANMRTYTSSRYGETFARNSDDWEVADTLADLIEGATTSIRIAHGHLRARPVVEALLAKRIADPDVEIQVYVDGQEYTSEWYYSEQADEHDDCIAASEDDGDVADCNEQGLYFGYAVSEADIDLRYKYYAYRWDYTYAEQMHHKYMLIDDDTLVSGSYNLSANAEFDTIENIAILSADRYPALVADYVANFASLWQIGQDGEYDDMLTELSEGEDDIELVFEPMALTWSEVEALKDAIQDACPDVDSDEYREDPGDHQSCPR